MSPYCPRCDVDFEIDLARCPGCGWDFRATRIPEGFLETPLDLAPLRHYWRFLLHDVALIWINGLTVQILWVLATLIIHRVAYVVLRLLLPGEVEFLRAWVPPVAAALTLILFFPVWANYLFSLLRRYRYHVPVALFQVLPPRGRSLYAESIGWGLPCLLSGALLLALLVVPGVLCLAVFVPMLLLIHLDKRNISVRRKGFILSLMFRRLWALFLLTGVILSLCWMAVFAIGFAAVWAAVVMAALFLPAQAAFSVLLYESLLGRENLDVD